MALIFAIAMMTGCSATENITENPTENTTESFILTMQIDNPQMTVNGTEKEIDPGRGTVPVVQNDRTLVPIRAIIEAMGGKCRYFRVRAGRTVHKRRFELQQQQQPCGI